MRTYGTVKAGEISASGSCQIPKRKQTGAPTPYVLSFSLYKLSLSLSLRLSCKSVEQLLPHQRLWEVSS